MSIHKASSIKPSKDYVHLTIECKNKLAIEGCHIKSHLKSNISPIFFFLMDAVDMQTIQIKYGEE